MAWVAGKSGNPNGRPKKERTLSNMLELIGSESVEGVYAPAIPAEPGVPTPPPVCYTKAQLVARATWEILLTGKTIFPISGHEIKVDNDQWIALLKWVYTQVDGPPKTELDVTSGGEQIARIEVIHEEWKKPDGTADDTLGSAEDREPESKSPDPTPETG